MIRKRPADAPVAAPDGDEPHAQDQAAAAAAVAPSGAKAAEPEPHWSPAEWMSQLPASLTRLPITRLAIPGSHDSLTYSLDKEGPLGDDLPRLARALSLRSALARSTIYNWSRTQERDVGGQLRAGARYLDVRAARRPDNGALCAVHGLYGPALKTALEHVSQFVREHSAELVVVDFNHFYSYDDEAHEATLAMLKAAFGAALVPRQQSLAAVTLDFCRQHKYNVLCIYQPSPREHLHRSLAESAGHVWLWNHVRSPWADSCSSAQVIGLAEHYLCKRHAEPAAAALSVAQLVATPKEIDVARHLGQSATLDTAMADGMTAAAVRWLDELLGVPSPPETDANDNAERRAVAGALNVAIVDFVHRHDFCHAVVRVNYAEARRE